MKGVVKGSIRFVWRRVFAPILNLLPVFRRNQILTLAHQIKLIFVHGEALEFESIVNDESELVPESEGGAAADSEAAGKPSSLVPDWIVGELTALAAIEPDLFPTPELIDRFVLYVPPIEVLPGEIYAKCATQTGESCPDIIFLIPWLVQGGADQGVLHHIDAALAVGMKVLVISTIERVSPWKERIPEGVVFLELGNLAGALSESQRLSVLTRIVVQSSAQVVHIINSPLGWEMVKHHGRSLLALEKRIFASVFCDDYNDHGVLRSYPQMYFVDCWRFLSGVMCDTRWYPKDLKRQYGVSLDKFSTVYFPAALDQVPVYRATSQTRILWASRFSSQKRLDLLIEIARSLPAITFDVYGYAVHEHERLLAEELGKLENVNIFGAFESLSALTEEGGYSLLLFTSGWEGLPITLLDATAAGLPIVASAVGGVPEFVTEDSGYPVFETNDPCAYVSRIREAMADELGKKQKWDSAVRLLLERHSFGTFYGSLQKVPGYFIGGSEEGFNADFLRNCCA